MARLIANGIFRQACWIAAPALLVALLVSAAQADGELRWKFKAGEKSAYEMKMHLTQDTKAGDMPFQVKISQTMDMTWEVKEVSDDGDATMTQTIDRVRMEMTLPQAGQAPIKYDTQQKDKAPGTEALAKIFDAMVGQPFILKVTPLGKVIELKAPEVMVAAFKAMPGAQGGGMFSEDGLKQMISQSMLPLPEEAVTPGKTWEKSTETQAPPFGKQVITTQYKYAGPEEFEGKKVDKVDVSLDVKLEPVEDAQAKFKLKENTSDGAIMWDNVAGQPLESRVNSKMIFEITVGTMSIEQTVTTDSVMKKVTPSEAREL